MKAHLAEDYKGPKTVRLHETRFSGLTKTKIESFGFNSKCHVWRNSLSQYIRTVKPVGITIVIISCGFKAECSYLLQMAHLRNFLAFSTALYIMAHSLHWHRTPSHWRADVISTSICLFSILTSSTLDTTLKLFQCDWRDSSKKHNMRRRIRKLVILLKGNNIHFISLPHFITRLTVGRDVYRMLTEKSLHLSLLN